MSPGVGTGSIAQYFLFEFTVMSVLFLCYIYFLVYLAALPAFFKQFVNIPGRHKSYFIMYFTLSTWSYVGNNAV